MSQKILYISFLAIVALGVVFYLGVRAGLYPVAIVDSNWITAARFREEFDATKAYFTPAVAQARARKEPIDETALEAEYRRASMDRLVEITLVRKKAFSLFGTGLKKERDKIIGEARLDPAAVEASVKIAYGWDFPTFTKLVVVPQAEKDLITASLAEKKMSYDEWLAIARKDASVYLLIRGLSWEGEHVVSK